MVCTSTYVIAPHPFGVNACLSRSVPMDGYFFCLSSSCLTLGQQRAQSGGSHSRQGAQWAVYLLFAMFLCVHRSGPLPSKVYSGHIPAGNDTQNGVAYSMYMW